jgi:hypothetical protein
MKETKKTQTEPWKVKDGRIVITRGGSFSIDDCLDMLSALKKSGVDISQLNVANDPISPGGLPK